MRKFVIIGLCVSLLGLSLIVEAQKVKTVDGVKIISNGKKPKPPKGSPSKLDLTEEMTWGDSDDPERSFAGMELPFTVDENGTIYAVDMEIANIKIFNSEGQFLKAFGNKGQGPGEFSLPSGITLTQDNTLMIEDSLNRRLVFYSKQGEHLNDVSTATNLGLARILRDREGNLLGMEIGLGEGSTMFMEYKKYDKDLNPMFTLTKVEFPLPIPGSGNKLNLIDMLIGYQFDRDGNVFFCRNKEYAVEIYSPSGKHVRTIKKEYKPVKVTQEDIDEMLERIPNTAPGGNIKDLFEFPKLFPPMQNFVLDEENRLFVRTYNKGKIKGEYVIDIFNSEGVFVSQLTTKADFRIWKNHKVYSVEENEDGYKILKRYDAAWVK